MSVRLSRRAFFGGTAALVAAGSLPAGEQARPALADEPPLPPGVCKRLGSARFRELTEECRFTPDSKWLAQLENGRFLAYQVATGRRIRWLIPTSPRFGLAGAAEWVPTNGEVVVIDLDGTDANDQPAPLRRLDLHTGRELKTPKLPQGTHYIPTPDGAAVIGYDDGPRDGVLWRTDLHTGKTVWKRKWRTDATTPSTLGEVMGKWLVLRGTQRLYLFDPLTGAPGPTLEALPPKDPLVSEHFLPLNLSADGRRLAAFETTRVPHLLVVWDVPTGRVVGRLTPANTEPHFALSPDGSCLLTTTGLKSQLVGLDVTTGKVVRAFPVENVGRLLLSPDGTVLVAPHGLSNDPAPFGGFGGALLSAGPVRLLDPLTGRPLPQSPDPPADFTNPRFLGPHTLLTDLHSDVRMPTLAWDTCTGTRRTVPRPPAPRGFGLDPSPGVLSPDGTRRLLSTGDELVVTDAASRRRLHALPMTAAGGPEAVWVDRRTVARLDVFGLHLFDLGTHARRLLKSPTGGGVYLTNVTASTDGRTVVATGHEDMGAKPFAVWIDVTDGTATTLPLPLPVSGDLKVSADGRRVAVNQMGEAGVFRVMVFDRGGRHFHLPALDGMALPFALSACGRTVTAANYSVAEGAEGVGLVWSVQGVEVATGDARVTFPTGHVVDGVAASPCGRRFATVSREAPVYLWDVYGEESDPKPKPDTAGLLAAWAALVGDADKAFAAVRLLVQHPAEAVRLLKEKHPPAVAVKPEWVRERVVRLGSDDYRTRSTAERELSAVADRIADQLREAEADTPEAGERLERILSRAGRMTRERLREVRAVEVLEYAGAESAGVLKALAAGADSLLTREAKAAVARRAFTPAP